MTKNNNFNTTHPEMKSGEVFLLNIHVNCAEKTNLHNGGFNITYFELHNPLSLNFRQIPFKSKRLGMQAYDRNGNKIGGMRPVFIKKVKKMEYTDKHIAARETVYCLPPGMLRRLRLLDSRKRRSILY